MRDEAKDVYSDILHAAASGGYGGLDHVFEGIVLERERADATNEEPVQFDSATRSLGQN
ncbi:MAG: hypothetical protein AAGE61_19400 [Pseudomonadota bacterium]